MIFEPTIPVNAKDWKLCPNIVLLLLNQRVLNPCSNIPT